MPRFPSFRFDLVSFWIGFISAIVIWWALSRLKGVATKIKKWISIQSSEKRVKKLSVSESGYREYVLSKAQRMHIASELFTLDEIIVEPKLLAPPIYIVDPQNNTYTPTIADQVIPYCPDWPELSSYYPVSKLTLAQACYHNVNIVVIGQPGVGKTVSLADMASMIARRERRVGKFANYLPILLHVLDINPEIIEQIQPEDNLIASVIAQIPSGMQAKVTILIKNALTENQAFLLLDGLDELPSERFDAYVLFLRSLLKRFPHLQIVCTASPEYLGELSQLGFFPLALAGWNAQDRFNFILKWGKVWNRVLSIEISKQLNDTELDVTLASHWFTGLHPYFTPLEITLTLWGAYSGDQIGLAAKDVIESYFSRCAPGIPHQALEFLASQYLQLRQTALSQQQLETILNKYKPSKTEPPEIPQDSSSQSKKEAIPEPSISSGSKIISILIENKVLHRDLSGNLRFSNPYFPGYLASFMMERVPPNLSLLPRWAVEITALNFLASQGYGVEWIKAIVSIQDPALMRQIGLIGRWARDLPADSESRLQILRKISSLLQQESVPDMIKAGFLTVCVRLNDPAISQLFKQMLSQQSSSTRLLGAIGLGAIRSSKYNDELLALYSDPDTSVRCAACLALSAIGATKSTEILAETLLRGDETLRQTAAEAFGRMPGEGHDVLRDAITMDDLLTRRAAIHGLVLIRDEWVRSLLEQVSIQDGQWIVRNAAAQALEQMQRPFSYIPQRLTRPSETPWLIDFAAKQGVGIPADELAKEMLILALDSGKPEERSAALRYLANYRDEVVIKSIFDIIYRKQESTDKAAFYALWIMSSAGTNIPAPQKYGYDKLTSS